MATLLNARGEEAPHCGQAWAWSYCDIGRKALNRPQRGQEYS